MNRNGPNLQPGTAFGGFRIEKELGRGAMGVVYRAVQLNLGRRVALKVLPVEAEHADSDYVDRFLNEARAAASLTHPNIVQVYDAGCAEGYLYFAMELIVGENLLQILEKGGRFSPLRLFNVVLPLIDALSYGWSEMHLVHGDLKPENIMMDSSGRVKLTDFGLAKIRSQNQEDGQACLMTPAYAAPEILTGKSGPCCSSDIYAFGATLYHLLAGAPVFEHPDPMEIMRLQVSADPLPLKDRIPGFPETISDFVAAMLAKDPWMRPRSWLEVRMALYGAMNSVIPGMDIPVAVPKIARPVQVEAPEEASVAGAPAAPMAAVPPRKPSPVVSRSTFMAVFSLCVILSVAVVGLAWRLYVVESQLVQISDALPPAVPASAKPTPAPTPEKPAVIAPAPTPEKPAVVAPAPTPAPIPEKPAIAVPGPAPETPTVPSLLEVRPVLSMTIEDEAADRYWTVLDKTSHLGAGGGAAWHLDFEKLALASNDVQVYLKRYGDKGGQWQGYRFCSQLASALGGCRAAPQEISAAWRQSAQPFLLPPETARLLFAGTEIETIDLSRVAVIAIEETQGITLDFQKLHGGESQRLRRLVRWDGLPGAVAFALASATFSAIPGHGVPAASQHGLALLQCPGDAAAWSAIWAHAATPPEADAPREWGKLCKALTTAAAEVKSSELLQAFVRSLDSYDARQIRAAGLVFLAREGEVAERYRQRVEAILRNLPAETAPGAAAGEAGR